MASKVLTSIRHYIGESGFNGYVLICKMLGLPIINLDTTIRCESIIKLF